jgi:hypothetical protein
MRSAAGRAFDEAVQELDMLQQLVVTGIHAEGVSAERAFRQGLQRISAYCHDCPDVLDACRTTRIAAVRAFAAPHETTNVAALESALRTIVEELRSARGAGDKPND